MFKRLLYKIHIEDIFALRHKVSKEAINLVLFICLLVFTSLFFASKSITSAASSTSTTTANSSTQNTTTTATTTPSFIPLDLTNPQVLYGLKVVTSQETGQMQTDNSASTNISTIPTNEYTSVSSYIASGKPIFSAPTTFDTKFIINHIPDNFEPRTIAQISPTAPVQDIQSFLQKIDLTSVTTQDQYYKTISNAISQQCNYAINGNPATIPAKDCLIQSSPTATNPINGIAQSNLFDGLSKGTTYNFLSDSLKKSGFTANSIKNDSQIFTNSLTNENASGKPANVELSLLSSNIRYQGALEVAANHVSSVETGPVIFKDPDPTHQLQTGEEAFSIQQFSLANDSIRPFSTSAYPFTKVNQSIQPNIYNYISQTATLPLMPMVTGQKSGGDFHGSITGPQSFADMNDAINYATYYFATQHITPTPQQISQKAAEVYNPSAPGTQLVTSIYTSQKSDACYFDILTNSTSSSHSCDILSFNSLSFTSNDNQHFFEFGTALGYPSGNNFNKYANALSTLSLNAVPDPFSPANTYLDGSFTTTITMQNTNSCGGVAGGCNVTTPTPITGKLAILGVGEEFNHYKLDDMLVNHFDTTPLPNYKEKVQKNLYSYDQVGPLQISNTAPGVSTLSRTISSSGYPVALTYYNPQNLVDVSNNHDYLPVNEAISSKLYDLCISQFAQNNSNASPDTQDATCLPDKNLKIVRNERLATNPDLASSGFIGTSRLDPNTFYGVVEMAPEYPIKDSTPITYVAYRANANDLGSFNASNSFKNTLEVAYISNISQFTPDILQYNQTKPIYGDPYLNPLKSAKGNEISVAQGAVNTVHLKDCPSITDEVLSSFYPMSVGDEGLDGFNQTDFYTRYSPYDKALDTGNGGCSSYGEGNIEDFSNVKNWSQPVRINKIDKVITAKEATNDTVRRELLAISPDRYDSHGHIYIYHALVDANTTWQQHDPNSSLGATDISPLDMGRQFNYNIGQGNTSRVAFDLNPWCDIKNDCNSNSSVLADDLTYAGAIAPNGRKYLLVAPQRTSDSTNIVLYYWDGYLPKDQKSINKIVYNFKDFSGGNIIPWGIDVTSLDVNPNTGQISFAVNGLYRNITIPKTTNPDPAIQSFLPDRTDPLNFIVPFIVKQLPVTKSNNTTIDGYQVYQFNPLKNEILYNSERVWRLSDKGSTPSLDMRAQEVVFGDDGNLYALINYAGNLSRISRVDRDASDQTLYPCNNNSYTKYINDGFSSAADEGKAICDILIPPVVDSSKNSLLQGFSTPTLSINDPDNFGKLQGKQALENTDALDFGFATTASATTPTGTPTTTNSGQVYRYYNPGDPQTVASHYLHRTPQPDTNIVKNLISSFNSNTNEKKLWDLIWPYAIVEAKQFCVGTASASSNCTTPLDPEVIMAWYWREIQFNLYAENCNDSTDPAIKSNVNRFQNPCNISSSGIWQNAAYQMTDHQLADYNDALKNLSDQSLQDIANQVIANSLTLTDPNSVYQRYVGIPETALPGGKFPSSINSFAQIFDLSTNVRALSNQNLFYLALLGKDPGIATYMNAKTLAADHYIDYNSGFYDPSNWMPYFYAIRDIINAYNTEHGLSPSNPIVYDGSTSNGSLTPLATTITSENGLGVRTLAPILSSSYLDYTNKIASEFNIPQKLLIAITSVETSIKSPWTQDSQYVTAAEQTQIGPFIATPNYANTVGSIKFGSNRNLQYTNCPYHQNSDGTVDYGIMQINVPGTYNDVKDGIRSKILNLTPGRIDLTTGNSLTTSNTVNPCDTLDNIGLAAQILQNKEAGCGGINTSWDLNKVFCVASLYNGGITGLQDNVTLNFNNSTYNISSPSTPYTSFYPDLVTKSYIAYGGT